MDGGQRAPGGSWGTEKKEEETEEELDLLRACVAEEKDESSVWPEKSFMWQYNINLCNFLITGVVLIKSALNNITDNRDGGGWWWKIASNVPKKKSRSESVQQKHWPHPES